MSADRTSMGPSKQLSAADHGTTLAAQVRQISGDISWSRARELCRTGRVLVDDTPVFDPARRMAAGVRVSVRESAPKRECPPLERDRVVYDEGGLLVADKPAGLAVTSDDPRHPDSLTARLALSTTGPSKTMLRPAHHLDPEITGLVAFTRDRVVRRGVEAQFRARTPTRRFAVLVWGSPEPGKIDAPLVNDDDRRKLWRGTGRPPRHARSAVTFVSVEERFDQVTLLSCETEGLRRHQLRVHLAARGTPIVGDSLYGSTAKLDVAQTTLATRLNRPLIHAGFLGLTHPKLGRLVHITCPLPPDFAAVLDELRGGFGR